MHWFGERLLCSSLLLSATFVTAQVPARRYPDTWAGQQASQSWAAEKLAHSSLNGEWVQVARGGRTLKGFVIQPKTNRKDKVPVVIVLHEVFGLTDSTRNTADEIAAMGYIAIVPDMLSGRGPNGGDVTSFPDSRVTSQALTSLSDETVNDDLNAWADYGRGLPASNGKFTVVGLSWGGGAAFRYAASTREDLKAVFVFYDVAPKADTIAKIQVPVYGFYGSTDDRVMATLDATRAEMAAASKKYQPVVFQGADHAFMRLGEDPSNGNPNDTTACAASLIRLKNRLAEAFR